MNETVEENKNKFKLRRPNRKWTDAETVKILEFITDTGYKFEKPTQLTYYNAMRDELKIDVTWSMLKFKVLSLKSSYKNVRKWREDLINAGLSAHEVEKTVLRTCPEYKRLNEVFGKQLRSIATSEQVFKFEDSLEFIECIEDNSVSSQLDHLFTDENEDLTTDYQTQQSTDDQNEHFPCTNKRKRLLTPPAELSQMFSLSNSRHSIEQKHKQTEKLKWDLDKEQFEKELRTKDTQLVMKEKELRSEKKFRNAEFELKKLKIEMDESIKKLEIEKNERIAMSEIKEKFISKNYCRSQEFQLKKLELEKDESIEKLEIVKNERIAMYEIQMKYKTQNK